MEEKERGQGDISVFFLQYGLKGRRERWSPRFIITVVSSGFVFRQPRRSFRNRKDYFSLSTWVQVGKEGKRTEIVFVRRTWTLTVERWFSYSGSLVTSTILFGNTVTWLRSKVWGKLYFSLLGIQKFTGYNLWQWTSILIRNWLNCIKHFTNLNKNQ